MINNDLASPVRTKREIYWETLSRQRKDKSKLFALKSGSGVVLRLACVASVSSRGSSRKLGQEQKKMNLRAITRLETLDTQAILRRSEVARLNSDSLNSDRLGTRLLEAPNEDSDDLSILDFTT